MTEPTQGFSVAHDNETHANAVDYSLIEPSKENIQPLRRGRNPHALLKALQPVTKEASGSSGLAAGRTEASVKAERKKFEAAIKAYPEDGPTPLQPWLAYISWTQQTYLTASLKSHLLPLLEKCTRTFLRDERVRNTLKYLHIWCMYMDLVEDCLDMFAFLHSNGVCTKHAALYIGWSQVLESKGRLQDAQDTLQMGINFGAEPVSNLRNNMTRLAARTARTIAAKVAANPEELHAPALTGEQRVQAAAQRLADENGTTVRQPLQRIGAASGSHREPIFERPVNGQTIYAPPPAPAMPKFSATNSNFQIFCDDMSSSLPAAAAPAAFASVRGAAAAAPSGPQWREYATVSQIGKENRSLATKWNAPLHPSADAASGGVPEGAVVTLPVSVCADFPVFEDAECAEEEAAKERDRVAEQAREDDKLQPRALRLDGPLKAANMEKGGLATMAKLQANPLRNMKK